jgi:Ca2+-binding EF-hand superfamily protein
MAAHRLFILVFAALLFLPVNAAAQVSGQYRAWDRNNDGVISRWEWRGDAQEFRDLDWNRDGVLSGSELRDQSWRSSDRWDNETFLTLDRNRNGSIARGEWRGDPATFRELDRNGDNQITRAEFLNADAGYADARRSIVSTSTGTGPSPDESTESRVSTMRLTPAGACRSRLSWTRASHGPIPAFT